jgi:hypothetical protein
MPKLNSTLSRRLNEVRAQLRNGPKGERRVNGEWWSAEELPALQARELALLAKMKENGKKRVADRIICSIADGTQDVLAGTKVQIDAAKVEILGAVESLNLSKKTSLELRALTRKRKAEEDAMPEAIKKKREQQVKKDAAALRKEEYAALPQERKDALEQDAQQKKADTLQKKADALQKREDTKKRREEAKKKREEQAAEAALPPPIPEAVDGESLEKTRFELNEYKKASRKYTRKSEKRLAEQEKQQAAAMVQTREEGCVLPYDDDED